MPGLVKTDGDDSFDKILIALFDLPAFVEEVGIDDVAGPHSIGRIIFQTIDERLSGGDKRQQTHDGPFQGG